MSKISKIVKTKNIMKALRLQKVWMSVIHLRLA